MFQLILTLVVHKSQQDKKKAFRWSIVVIPLAYTKISQSWRKSCSNWLMHTDPRWLMSYDPIRGIASQIGSSDLSGDRDQIRCSIPYLGSRECLGSHDKNSWLI